MAPFWWRRSKKTAKERLRLILIHDRMELTPAKMEELKKDLRDVLQKHLDVETEEFEISVSRKRDSMALEADIPLKDSR